MNVGRVVFATPNLAMLVVQHEEGFAVVEMLGNEGQIVVGDVVYGDWTEVAGESIRCKGEEYDAFFQGCWGDPNLAIRVARG